MLAVAAYLVGSVSPSYLLVRFKTGEDVRQTGSRNAGTLNTYNRLGIMGALVVLALDVGKGTLSVLVPTLVNAPEWTIFATAPLVLIGHNWPVLLQFRGGKGAAVLLGVSLGLFPAVTAVCLIAIALVMILFRNVVLGAATGYVLVCIALIIVGTEWPMVMLSILITLLAGATYLFGFRRQISALIQHKQWRRLLSFRFVE
jgi:glycerol-3-phosphate acyltransferase PlsY